MATDTTVKILGEIRDAVQQTNARLDQTNARLDRTRDDLTAAIQETNTRLGSLENRLGSLENHVVGTEIRLATAITALSGDLGEVKELLRERRSLDARVDRCEQDIAELKQRVGK